jgi:hypothetical protein
MPIIIDLNMFWNACIIIFRSKYLRIRFADFSALIWRTSNKGTEIQSVIIRRKRDFHIKTQRAQENDHPETKRDESMDKEIIQLWRV